jgi:hypothetical protein
MERVPGNLRRREGFAGPPDDDRRYGEDEVNRLLARVNDDFATLRRFLVDAHLLTRERNEYRRV